MERQDDELDEIWRGDLLKRREEATRILKYLTERYSARPSEKGFVLAIDADWGVGKSFMLERWYRQVKLLSHPAVLFDAWKNDFAEAPLLAFIAELHEGLDQYISQTSLLGKAKRNAKSKLKQLWKPTLTILGSAVAKHLVGLSLSQVSALMNDNHDSTAIIPKEIERLKSDSRAAATELSKAIDKALNDHKTLKIAIATFKETLKSLIDELSEAAGVELPLLIFVDELDRCRPNYSIELMEGIKHLFGVPGVYFIVSINIEQLSESVKAVYGNGFDSKRYLKRFFDLHYSLPEPLRGDFVRFVVEKIALPANIVFDYGNLDQYDNVDPRLQQRNDSRKILDYVFERHVIAFDLSLRDQEQIGNLLEAAILGLRRSRVHVFLLVFLAVVYHLDPVVLKNIERTESLDAATGFQEIYEDSTQGRISFKSYDNNGKGIPNSVSVKEIATVYLSHMRTDAPNSRSYSRDFPGDLPRSCEWSRKGTVYFADYISYFDAIRSAASFKS